MVSDVFKNWLYEFAVKSSSDGFIFDKFEGVQGVYLICGEHGEVLYVGESSNLRVRLKQHASKPKFKERIGYFNIIPMKHSLIDESKERLKLESILIDILNPKYNIRNKGESMFLESITVERIVREDESTWFE